MPEEFPSTNSPESPAPNPAPLSPAPAPTTARRIFFGPDGLRAAWSLLLFTLLVGLLILPTVPIFRHLLPQHAATAHTSAPRQPAEHPVSATLVQDGSLFVVVLLASFTMSRIERRPFAAYGLGATPGALRHILLGLLWGILFLSLLVLALKLTHLLAFDRRLLSGPAILRYAAEWFAGFLMVGFFEEYLLRGFLLFTLARGLSGLFALTLNTSRRDTLGFWTAATLLAFVFGLGHRSNPGESPLGLLAAGLAALVFSLSLWRTGSLWWAIGFHAAWDWAQSFLYGVADSGMMTQHHLLASHPIGTPLLSGGLTGPEGSLLVLPVLALAAAVIGLTLYQPTPNPFTRHRLTINPRHPDPNPSS